LKKAGDIAHGSRFRSLYKGGNEPHKKGTSKSARRGFREYDRPKRRNETASLAAGEGLDSEVVANASSIPAEGIGLKRSALDDAVDVMGGRTERGLVARTGDEGGDMRVVVVGAPSHDELDGGVGVVGRVIENAADAVVDVGRAERWRARAAEGGGGEERLIARAAILNRI